jgi:hypothetical protein
MGLIIRCYHQIHHYPSNGDVQPNGKGNDRNFFMISKSFGYGSDIGDQYHGYDPYGKYNMRDKDEIVNVFHHTFPTKRGRI